MNEPIFRRTPWMRLKRAINLLVYLVAALVFVLGSVELILRSKYRNPTGYYVWPPNLEHRFQATPEGSPGVTGVAVFRTNGEGIRGPEIPKDARNLILVIGGSTTEETYLNRDESWTGLLEIKYNRLAPGSGPWAGKTWVGNMGKSGSNSLHHVLQLRYVLPRLPRMDLIVCYVGANDLQYFLAAGYPPNMTLEQELCCAFSSFPSPQPSFWDAFATTGFLRAWKQRLQRQRMGIPVDTNADWLLPLRKKRQSTPESELLRKLPDMSPATARYRANINQLIDHANGFGSPIVFITQATLWDAKMGEAEKKLLYAGGVGHFVEWAKTPGQKYYAPEVLAQGMGILNGELRKICAERKQICVDLAARLPRNAEFFQDDMHFSERGAAAAADVVFQELLKNPPPRWRP